MFQGNHNEFLRYTAIWVLLLLFVGVCFFALGSLFVNLGGSCGGVGSILGALGPSWWVLVAQGPDPKAILAIPGGQGGGGPPLAVNSTDLKDP